MQKYQNRPNTECHHGCDKMCFMSVPSQTQLYVKPDNRPFDCRDPSNWTYIVMLYSVTNLFCIFHCSIRNVVRSIHCDSDGCRLNLIIFAQYHLSIFAALCLVDFLSAAAAAAAGCSPHPHTPPDSLSTDINCYPQ